MKYFKLEQFKPRETWIVNHETQEAWFHNQSNPTGLGGDTKKFPLAKDLELVVRGPWASNYGAYLKEKNDGTN